MSIDCDAVGITNQVVINRMANEDEIFPEEACMIVEIEHRENDAFRRGSLERHGKEIVI